MRVAAYQAALLALGSMEALGLIRRRVEQCEAEGVTILCCPEAILGGLADDVENPASVAIQRSHGDHEWQALVLASDRILERVARSSG
jgi:predicted amidohydrolase